MKKKTRQDVHVLLSSFARASLKSYDLDALKRAYPFHRLFFDEAGLVAFKQERSIVTKMGRSLYPRIAALIAKERYANVFLEHKIRGTLNKAAISTIDTIERELRSRQRIPNRTREVAEVMAAVGQGGTREDVRLIADFYIGDFDDGPLFVEIKTPLPNLDICAETKKKFLTFIALYAEKNPQAYFGFAYNPFVTREAYSHSFTNQIMDIQDEVLMGEEFWDHIGGRGTFLKLLEIIEEVGEEIRLKGVR
jgi:hypothetical protein